MAETSAPRQPPLGKHLWPAFGKPRVPGDILFWPRDDQRVLGIPIKFTHWAVYVGRRKLAPCRTRWMVGVCETTGDVLPESVVHLWGAADSAARDTSADAVVVHNRLSELGGAPYDGNLAYDDAHTPRRPEQILRRVLVSLGAQKTYETRFGKYHVVGNNCEHFATWCRYGVNRSDQIGDAVKFIGAGLGAVGLGAPGALIGGYAANELIRSTYKTRLDETWRNEFLLFENTDGCEFANDDAETDWVVECLIRSTEEFEWRGKAERVAHASGRAHLPRAHSPDLDRTQSSATASHTESRVFDRDVTHVTQNERRTAAAAKSAKKKRDENEERTTEVFSVDSLGNVGGLLGEGLRAFGEGLRGVMRDGGEEATPAGRANPEARGDDENSGSSERASSSESSADASSSRATKEKEEPSSSRDRGRRPEDGGAEPLKDAVAGVGSLFGAMLGGVLKVGGALASEVANQHENHRRRVEKERSSAARASLGGADAPSSNPGADGQRAGLAPPRRGPMVIQEVE